jgi:hypothetical protein
MALSAGSNKAVPEITATDNSIQFSIKKFTHLTSLLTVVHSRILLD